MKSVQTGRTVAVGLLLVLVLSLQACSDTMKKTTKTRSWPLPTGAWHEVVPGTDMPTGVTTFVSNNNLDAILWGKSLYLVFRTAPNHFASGEALLYVLRTEDLHTFGNWKLELKIHTGKDLREPRFFLYANQLFLYYAELGTSAISFEPGRVVGQARSQDGVWGAPRDVFTDGTIVWRTKNRNGRVYMSAYRGGETIYQNRSDNSFLELMFMTTDDGWNWHGVDGAASVVLRGGISETAFEFDDAGNLWTVSRNEAGDATGFGSRFCRARAGNLGVWECPIHGDPNKYDSPFMFAYQNNLYLIARYNPGGPYDLEPGAPPSQKRFQRNEVRYSTTSKRTALYGYDPDTLSVRLLDLFPSAGDTAFASGVWLDDEHLAVFNYSSNPDRPDMTWLEGQFDGSRIYAAILDFSAAIRVEGTVMDPSPRP